MGVRWMKQARDRKGLVSGYEGRLNSAFMERIVVGGVCM